MYKTIKISLLTLSLATTIFVAKAQKVVEQGIITVNMKYDLTPEQQDALGSSMLPSESKLKFSGDISLIEMNLGPALIKVYSGKKENRSIFLVDIPIIQKQYAAKLSKAEVEEQMGSIKFSDFIATGLMQKIAGYNAEKYTYKDQNGGQYELWATKDIILSSGAVPYGFDVLDNVTPVKYIHVQNGIKTEVTVKSIANEKVGPFSLDIPAGYEEKTLAELKAMQEGQ